MFKTRLLAAAACLVAPLAAFAQEGNSSAGWSHDSIVVTGRRDARQQELAEAAERLSQRAGATALIAAEDFEKGRATTLSDIMAYAPGVYAQTRHGEEVRF